MKTEAKFEHKGIGIEFLPDGRFEAKIDGERVVKVSLDSMKKAIDKAAAEVFVQFDALVSCTGYQLRWLKQIDGIRYARVRIVGARESKGRLGTKFVYLIKTPKGDETISISDRIYRDTPEAIAALKAEAEYAVETDRIEIERSKGASKLREAAARFMIGKE